MIFYFTTILAASLAIVSTLGASSAPCPSDTIAVNITSLADVENLTDVLSCAGVGSFHITWLATLTLEERIEVSDNKNVTITGAGVLTTIRGALFENNNAGGIVQDGSDTGIFSVSNCSTLRLNHLAFQGGNAEKGGAVEVLSSSFLFVFGCIFTCNRASNGGESPLSQGQRPS